jgi:hypothetical protein
MDNGLVVTALHSDPERLFTPAFHSNFERLIVTATHSHLEWFIVTAMHSHLEWLIVTATHGHLEWLIVTAFHRHLERLIVTAMQNGKHSRAIAGKVVHSRLSPFLFLKNRCNKTRTYPTRFCVETTLDRCIFLVNLVLFVHPFESSDSYLI